MLVDIQPTHLPGNQGVNRWNWSGLAYFGLVVIAFSPILIRLLLYSAGTELHSHVPLVPLISAYLLYQQRKQLPLDRHPSWFAALAFSSIGLVILYERLSWFAQLSMNDELALGAFAFVSFVAGGGFLFYGERWMAAAAFPASFLFFLIPMPDAVANALEVASMKASADVAAAFLKMTSTPFVRDGQVFQLPGIVLRVAEECSGIRSSWVLLITGCLAAHMFLKSRWRGLLVIAFVVPLGIVRNGFRILVIALLCVYIGPEMIDSAIHRHGGPLFFVLSLGPLFLLLLALRRSER